MLCNKVTCCVIVLIPVQAIAKLGWMEALPIQKAAIPLAISGKDILARARTGSGKTAAYAIPVIQKILSTKHVSIFFVASCLLSVYQLFCHTLLTSSCPLVFALFRMRQSSNVWY